MAIVFYNYPAGKANIGASYLNVAESIAQHPAAAAAAEGYDLGHGGAISRRRRRAEGSSPTKARNVGGYAPGELQALVEAGRGGAGSA